MTPIDIEVTMLKVKVTWTRHSFGAYMWFSTISCKLIVYQLLIIKIIHCFFLMHIFSVDIYFCFRLPLLYDANEIVKIQTGRIFDTMARYMETDQPSSPYEIV